MKYVKAYQRTWLNLFGCASVPYLTLVFVGHMHHYKVDSWVMPYILYLVSFVAFGGVVREWME